MITFPFLFLELNGYNTDTLKTFIVTFDPDGGTSVAGQTVEKENNVIEPTVPIKLNDKGGLYLGTPPDYIFIGWFNGNTQWNFNSPVTSNITLKARWTQPVPINLAEIVGDNILYKTFSYLDDKDLTEEYTLLLDSDITYGYMTTPSNYNLTIIGIGGEKTIRDNGDEPLRIRIGSNVPRAILTIGKNITLNSSDERGAISVFNGNFTMLDGSKIVADFGVSLSNSNNYPDTFFDMNGGIITGEVRISGVDTTQLTLSGNATIEVLSSRSAWGIPKIIVSSDWVGSVGELNLTGAYSIDELKNYFQDKILIQGNSGYTLTQADITRFPLGGFNSQRSPTDPTILETKPISDTHKLELDVLNNAIKLIAK